MGGRECCLGVPWVWCCGAATRCWTWTVVQAGAKSRAAFLAGHTWRLCARVSFGRGDGEEREGMGEAKVWVGEFEGTWNGKVDKKS